MGKEFLIIFLCVKHIRAYRVLVEKYDHLDDLGVDSRIILKWIFYKSFGMAQESWIMDP
jgi:hypothetical protein